MGSAKACRATKSYSCCTGNATAATYAFWCTSRNTCARRLWRTTGTSVQPNDDATDDADDESRDAAAHDSCSYNTCSDNTFSYNAWSYNSCNCPNHTSSGHAT